MTPVARLRRADRTSDVIWLALALIVGTTLRFWNIADASLYSDEGFTFAAARQPIAALLQTIRLHDFHPPLFYVTTHVVMQWLRWPLGDYRFITAACGLVTIVATWGFTRRLFGPAAGAMAAVFVALQPALVQFDRLFRMHAVTVALCALGWWLLVELEASDGKKRLALWIAYALVALALPYNDYLGGLVLLTQVAYALASIRARWPVLLCAALVVVEFLPWLGALRTQFPLGGLAQSRPALDSSLLASLRGAFAAGSPDSWLQLPGFDALVGLLLAAVIVAGAWLGRKTALPYWLTLLPLQIILSLALAKNLAYFPRYLLPAVPAVAVCLAVIIVRLVAARQQIAALAAATTALVVVAVGVANLLFNPYYQFPDWYAVDALLVKNAQPRDAIILDAGYELLVVRDYRGFRGHPLLVFMNPHDFGAINRWLATHPQTRVWYVEHQNFYWDAQRQIAGHLASQRRLLLQWNEPRQSPVDAVRVALFDRIPMMRTR